MKLPESKLLPVRSINSVRFFLLLSITLTDASRPRRSLGRSDGRSDGRTDGRTDQFHGLIRGWLSDTWIGFSNLISIRAHENMTKVHRSILLLRLLLLLLLSVRCAQLFSVWNNSRSGWTSHAGQRRDFDLDFYALQLL